MVGSGEGHVILDECLPMWAVALDLRLDHALSCGGVEDMSLALA